MGCSFLRPIGGSSYGGGYSGGYDDRGGYGGKLGRIESFGGGEALVAVPKSLEHGLDECLTLLVCIFDVPHPVFTHYRW